MTSTDRSTGAPEVRLHHHLIASVVETLDAIFAGAAADRAVEAALRQHPKWGSRDRRLFAEHVYDLVRWRRWYAWLAGPEGGETADAWKMWAAYWITNGGGESDFPECAGITAAAVEAKKNASTAPAVAASFPDWLWDMATAEIGSGWPEMAAALNKTAPVFLRANTLRTTIPALIAALKKEGVATEPVPDIPGALRLEKRAAFQSSAAHRGGLFEVQDAASQMIAPMLGAEPGMLVIDGCAGAGGKSLHLAALMQNQGRIISQDVRASALETLRDRAVRAGASIIRTEEVTSPETLQKRAGTADRLLLDAPCSGLGVLRRNPGAKWKLTAAELDRLTALQREILRTAPVMLKPGGRMVYATCSILPRENEQQIRSLMAGQPGMWELEDERHLPPGAPGDGFYAARLRRK